MSITDILNETGIAINLKSKNKHDVLNELVDMLHQTYDLGNIEDIRKAIFEREKLSSTGICNGLAIPHAKVSGIKKMVGGIGLSKEGIDFQSMDGVLSSIFFILISPKEDHGSHVKALARITKILKDEEVRVSILSFQNNKEVLEYMKDIDEKLGT